MMAAACPAKMRRRRWKTAAAFWAGHSWGCCSVRSAAAGWAGACSWSLRLKRAPERWLYAGESRPDGTVELRTDTETEQEQRRYHLRAMLVREMRTMPERGDPEKEL